MGPALWSHSAAWSEVRHGAVINHWCCCCARWRNLRSWDPEISDWPGPWACQDVWPLSRLDQSEPGIVSVWPIMLQECGHPVGLSPWCHQSPPRNHSRCQISPTFHIRKLYNQGWLMAFHSHQSCWKWSIKAANQPQLLRLVLIVEPVLCN